jgi:NAD(P)-dependent dehydrogenase (short-subunit alcohol dehydrogenase family)
MTAWGTPIDRTEAEMLKGKRVVIVGGSSGMGLAGAKAAAQHGAHVIIAGRSEKKLKAVLERIKGKPEYYAGDFTLEENVSAFFDKIGNFDHLVVTAGGKVLPAGFVWTETSVARAVLDGKFWVQYLVAKRGAGHLNAGGSITLFSGIFSRRPSKGFAALAANNGAIEALGRALAVELAPIRVNVISPGMVDTPIYHAMPAEQRESMFEATAKALPVGRVGTPEDVGETIIYLMQNGYTTGSVVDVDGGARLA